MTSPEAYSPCPCGSGKKYKFCCLQKDRDAARKAAADGKHVHHAGCSHGKDEKPPKN